ncbi:hypothetical protein AB0395_34995 [Streptosporangium sp. NPDC051023]|uniref:hypothetical protein n=1 Tax=Streptosporangium sp. NPDC051023 TaxID=3155410 RepID=UPI00344D334A
MSAGRFRHTVAVDFDRVVHDYLHGYQDGSIYGDLVPGAVEALHALMRDFMVVIFTARLDVIGVASWIRSRTGISAVVEPLGERVRRWRPGEVLVTNRKVPALAYVDDRSVVFRAWLAALADVYALSDLACPGGAMNDQETGNAGLLEEIRRLCSEEDPASAVAAIREALGEPVKAPRSAKDLEIK